MELKEKVTIEVQPKIAMTICFLVVFALCVWSFDFLRNQNFAAKVQQPFIATLQHLKSLEDVADRPPFGWGSMTHIRLSLNRLEGKLLRCEYLAAIGDDVEYEVKVDHLKQRYRIVSIYSGAANNPALASCLRDQIEQTQLPELSRLSLEAQSQYQMRIGIRRIAQVAYLPQ